MNRLFSVLGRWFVARRRLADRDGELEKDWRMDCAEKADDQRRDGFGVYEGFAEDLERIVSTAQIYECSLTDFRAGGVW